MKKEKRRTGQFQAYSADEREFMIEEYTEFITTDAFNRPPEKKAGLKEYFTSDGMNVNLLDEDEGIFEILELRLKVNRKL